MSHKPVSNAFEELNGRLTDSARATLVRIARKIAGGYEGEIRVTVGPGGGIRLIEWVQREDGSRIKETVG